MTVSARRDRTQITHSQRNKGRQQVTIFRKFRRQQPTPITIVINGDSSIDTEEIAAKLRAVLIDLTRDAR